MRAVLRIVVRRAEGLPALPLNWDGRARHSVRAALLELCFGRRGQPSLPFILGRQDAVLPPSSDYGEINRARRFAYCGPAGRGTARPTFELGW